MFRKLQEKINIFVAKSPKKAVLVGIMLINITYVFVSAFIIFVLSRYLSGIRKVTFWQSVYYIITMILDAGCIDNVIADVGKAGTFAVIVCLAVIIMGMILFTGAVIGYVTNTISDFIDSKNNGKNRLLISNHIVIFNWNSRASEIINEFLYEKKKEILVVFVPDKRDEIDEEINEKLYDTIISENNKLYEKAKIMPFLKRKIFLKNNLIKNNLTVIVREGDISSSKDLDDICLNRANTVIVLESDDYFNQYNIDSYYGNHQTVKILVQLTEMSEKENANCNQKIIVEVGDRYTEDLLTRIKGNKENAHEVILIRYNELTGKILSQFSIMPELNTVYDYLFSNKGSYITSANTPEGVSSDNENMYIHNRLSTNNVTIPIAVKETIEGNKAFYLALQAQDIHISNAVNQSVGLAKIRDSVDIDKRLIFVHGHNSKMEFLMRGFESFVNEWNLQGKDEYFSVIMVDDEENLQNHNYYCDYQFVSSTIATDVLEQKTIDNLSTQFSKKGFDKITVLILSDDTAGRDYSDVGVLTHLIYLQELLNKKSKEDSGFRRDKLEIVVEVNNPQNAEIIRNYISGRVVICNTYLSSIIAQISSDSSIYDLYDDILSNDSTDCAKPSKELRIRTADTFFDEMPGKCTAEQLIRMVFNSGSSDNKSVLIGYIRDNTQLTIFEGDQSSIEVEIMDKDKLIYLSNR